MEYHYDFLLIVSLLKIPFLTKIYYNFHQDHKDFQTFDIYFFSFVLLKIDSHHPS